MADPTIDELYDYLDESLKAGDHDTANKVAVKIKAMKGQQVGSAPDVIRAVGETGADIATKMGGLGGAINKPLAAVGAAGSYLLPGQGSFDERYARELQGLQGRQAEASARSPMVAPAAEVAGYSLLPLSAAGAAPMTEAAATLPKTLSGALGRTAAGYGDAARFNVLTKALSGEPIGDAAISPANLMGVMGPVAREVGPMLNARASLAQAKANLHKATAAGVSSADQPIVEDKLLGATAYNPLVGRESVGQLASPFVKSGETTGEVAGRMGQAREKAIRVMSEARAAAEPTASVNHLEVVDDLIRLRNSIFSKADMTVPERESAVGRVNEIIDRVKTHFSPGFTEVPLSKWSELKSLWQGIAGSKPSGKPRTSAEIETKPVLEFFEGGGGILRAAEENAIAKVLPPEQAQAFNAAKRTYAVVETMLPMAQASARHAQPMTMIGEARHSWSPYHWGTRYGLGKILPQESTLAGYQGGKSRAMTTLEDVVGPASKEPSYMAAILAELLRKKENE